MESMNEPNEISVMFHSDIDSIRIDGEALKTARSCATPWSWRLSAELRMARSCVPNLSLGCAMYNPDHDRIPNPVSDLAGGVPKYVFFDGEHVDISI